MVLITRNSCFDQKRGKLGDGDFNYIYFCFQGKGNNFKTNLLFSPYNITTNFYIFIIFLFKIKNIVIININLSLSKKLLFKKI